MKNTHQADPISTHQTHPISTHQADPISKGYIPSEDEEYMNDRQLRYFESKLKAQQKELELKVKTAIQKLKTLKSESPDMLDQSNHESEIYRELKNVERNNNLLQLNKKALLRIENGYFGYCMMTGEAIGIKRLELIPTTNLSIEAMRLIEESAYPMERFSTKPFEYSIAS